MIESCELGNPKITLTLEQRISYNVPSFFEIRCLCLAWTVPKYFTVIYPGIFSTYEL